MHILAGIVEGRKVSRRFIRTMRAESLRYVSKPESQGGEDKVTCVERTSPLRVVIT